MAGKKVIKKHKGGRPSKISSINLEQVEKLILKGFTDKEIADFFDVNEDTYHNWKKKYPKFAESLKDWKKQADSVVERSLYERAKGYQHAEDKIFCEDGKVTIVPTIKHYPPDATSMIFWLKNRQPDKWKDRVETLHDMSENLVEKLKGVSKCELIQRINAIISGTDRKPV